MTNEASVTKTRSDSLKQLMEDLPGLSIESQTTPSSPRTPQTRNLLKNNVELRPNALKRSDTADSLQNLVGKSPSLAHLEDISFLPSPVAPDRFSNTISQQLSPRTEEHVEKEGAAGDSSSRTLQAVVGRTQPHGLLPPSLFARLQKEQRTQRTASLNPTQDLNKIELPRLIRHRSQTQVDIEDDLPPPREVPHVYSPYEHYNVQPEHTLAINREVESFEVVCDKIAKKYLAITTLGQGSFSRVVLARAQENAKELVALKIVDIASSEMADHDRVAMTVCREIELLQKVSTPLIVKLRGYLIDDDSALLVLDYFPGGDLFTLTADNRSLMTPSLVKRIFAEIVCAIRTLHQHNIAHRDLKLENILLRYQKNVLRKIVPSTGILTALTDLGLAREFDPEHPDLTTRCGSEDYAAPELIMGQAYDGRQTDAWALGVILYSMLEGRLPFDVIPGLEHRMKSKVLHRICRIEWRWVAYKDVGTYSPEWEGAKRIVTNLLRSRTKRWSLNQLASDVWICDEVAIVEGLVEKTA